MIKRRVASVALGFTALAVALALGPAAVAQRAGEPGWRIVFSHHYGGPATSARYYAIAGDGEGVAWAGGGADVTGSAHGIGWPVAAHWTGRNWFATRLPHGLTNSLTAISVDSGKDAWAISDLGGYVLHWTGSRWFVAKRFPETGLATEITGVTAFSPSNVWVFGGSGAFPGVGTWHLHAGRWTRVGGFGSNIAEASALSPTNMWAVGGVTVGDDSIMHYAGGRWLHVTAKQLAGRQFRGIVALPGGQVWASAGSAVLHLSHRRWRALAVPWRVDLGSIAPDGQGGIWVTALAISGVAYALHLTSAGRWIKIRIGSSAGFGSMSLIKGTTALWGGGGIGKSPAVFAHGTLP